MDNKVFLASRKNSSHFTDRCIRWWTNGEYSHNEVLVNGFYYSSSMRDGGVRRKKIDTSNPSEWYTIEIPWVTSKEIEDYYEKTKYRKYGLLDLVFTQVLNIRFSNSRSDFCSEWCAAAIGLPHAISYNPTELVETVKYINNIINT